MDACSREIPQYLHRPRATGLREDAMKIAVKLTFFGEEITKLVEYPGRPHSQGEVIQWLMSQTDFQWTDYDKASSEDKLLYHLEEGTMQ